MLQGCYTDVTRRLFIDGVQYPRQEGTDLGVDARRLLVPDLGAVLARGHDTHQVHETRGGSSAAVVHERSPGVTMARVFVHVAHLAAAYADLRAQQTRLVAAQAVVLVRALQTHLLQPARLLRVRCCKQQD